MTVVTFNFPSDQVFYLYFEGWLSPSLKALILQEEDEYRAILGVKEIRWGKAPGNQPCWIIEESSQIEVSSLHWCEADQKIVSRVKDSSQILTTFSLLQSLAFPDDADLYYSVPNSVDDAIAKLDTADAPNRL